MLGASAHRGRQTPSIPPSFLTGIQLKLNHRFPRFQRASQEASTAPQHSGESDELYQHTPRDATCRIEPNIRIEQNIYLMHADFILMRSAVGGS